jgi:methionyl-tRNA formyltransferase
MKITVLLRYPLIENNSWKKKVVENLLSEGFEVSIIFGEKSYWRHLKAALKEYGLDFLKKKKSISSRSVSKTNLYKFFKNIIPVFTVADLNSPGSVQKAKDLNPDYILLLGTGIIRQPLLNIPAKGTVHCHHGQLPDFRGVSTAEWSTYQNRDVYITTHFADKGIDTGDIICEKKIPLLKGDNLDNIRLRCREYSVDLITETFMLLKSGQATIKKQPAQAGTQYFFMHPFFKSLLNKKLMTVSE